MKRKTAFAPATIGNVGVGFDVLGFAVDTIGDTVTVTRTENAGQIEIEKITWALQLEIPPEIPMDPLLNTATVGLFAFIEDLGLKCGFRVSVKKGIPLGSGMGGSAASAVAAIVAANATLAKPLPRAALMKYALLGEAAASGGIHADNVAPSLLGGLTLVRSVEPLDVISIPFPRNILSVLVHPDLKINTREARGVLNPSVALKDMVKQSGNLAAFVSGCHSQSTELIGRSLQDLIIEPQRKHLIAGFDDVKRVAMEKGALGCSISGSGPTVFAWADNPKKAKAVKTAMVKAFEQAGAGPVRAWTSKPNKKGAVVR